MQFSATALFFLQRILGLCVYYNVEYVVKFYNLTLCVSPIGIGFWARRTFGGRAVDATYIQLLATQLQLTKRSYDYGLRELRKKEGLRRI